MKELNLCIDIDGTVTEAYDWIPIVNRYFNTTITPNDVTVYDIYKILGVYGEALHLECRIRKGAKNVIDSLYQKHNIHFVSAREKRMKYVTHIWFDHYKIPMDSLTLFVFCKRKFLTFANFFPHPIGGEFLIIAAIFQLFILRLLSRNT